MISRLTPDQRGVVLPLVAIVMLLAIAGITRLTDRGDGRTVSLSGAAPPPGEAVPPPRSRSGSVHTTARGARGSFDDGRFLVAYYGTAGTSALGVLGETSPDRTHQRLLRAARPFARPSQPVLPVYKLIVTVADRSPGEDRDHNHDIARADVRRYVEDARRNGALLLLDIQPGRSDFSQLAKQHRLPEKLSCSTSSGPR